MANDNERGSAWDLLRKFKENAASLGSEVREAAHELGSEFKEAAKGVEGLAGKAALTAEQLRETFEVDKRLKGAAIGAKTGAACGLIGGPVGIKAGLIIGTGVGFVMGPQFVDAAEKNYEDWKDKHRPPKNDNGDQPAPGESMKKGP